MFDKSDSTRFEVDSALLDFATPDAVPALKKRTPGYLVFIAVVVALGLFAALIGRPAGATEYPVSDASPTAVATVIATGSLT